MNEQNGSARSYNPRDHLIKIKTRDGTLKDYYPAAWRLYELNLRYPNANFRTEILHLDVERNLVVVKCTLYLGSGDLEMAERRTEAMKSGLLSQLDKVETAAKSRCARDLGVSTELALELEPEEIAEVVSHESNGASPSRGQERVQEQKTGTELNQQVRDKLNDLYARAKKLGLCTNDRQFIMYIRRVLDNPHLDLKYATLEILAKVEDDIVTQEMAKALEEAEVKVS